MAHSKSKTILLGLALLGVATAAHAIDNAFRNPSAMQLAADDQALDSEIKDTILKIQRLHVLRDFKTLNLSPQQTYVRLNSNGECIEVDSHAVNHEMPTAKSAPIDYQVKHVRLCFAEKKLTKIESDFTAVSQVKRETTVNSFVHQDPTNVAVNDIVLSATYNNLKNANLRIGDLENSLTKPLRVSFKRDYYLPHLRNTAYILQLTYDLHKRQAVKTNEKAVNHYLNYAE